MKISAKDACNILKDSRTNNSQVTDKFLLVESLIKEAAQKGDSYTVVEYYPIQDYIIVQELKKKGFSVSVLEAQNYSKCARYLKISWK